MTKLNILILGLTMTVFIACDDSSQTTDTGISANRLINVPETADETKEVDPNSAAKIEFTETEYNFGEVESGAKVEHTFKFTNTGQGPLIISNARASCGCTVPEWPTDPIQPGDDGEIMVVFDSKGKSGVQNKVVTITANTQPSQTEVLIKGMVKSPKPTDQPS